MTLNQSIKPFYDIETDGVTQGLLGTFLDCREKARLFLQGYSLKETNLGLTFGDITHAALERIYGDIQSRRGMALIRSYVQSVERRWRKENGTASPSALQNLEVSLLLAEQILPVYLEYWKKDLKEIQWKALEREFALPYTLRDGRKLVLRGKLDGDFLSHGRSWLFETKTKSRIEEENLVDWLPLDRQVHLYLYALRQLTKTVPAGVLYNIIRRPQLKQGKGETLLAFATRMAGDIRERPEWYFLRLELSISAKEMDKWSGELEDLLTDFYDWWQGKAGHYKNTNMCETKYGRCEYLHICAARRMSHYYKRRVVFRELGDY